MRKLGAYFGSVLFAYIVAAVLVSQFNIARITALGEQVSVAERLQTAQHDLLGMLSSYLPLIAIALLLAFLFTGLVIRRFVDGSAALYALAGFCGLLVVHVSMNGLLGLHAVAPTRTLVGLLCQAGAGALGGWLYFKLSQKAAVV